MQMPGMWLVCRWMVCKRIDPPHSVAIPTTRTGARLQRLPGRAGLFPPEHVWADVHDGQVWAVWLARGGLVSVVYKHMNYLARSLDRGSCGVGGAIM